MLLGSAETGDGRHGRGAVEAQPGKGLRVLHVLAFEAECVTCIRDFRYVPNITAEADFELLG